MSRPLRGRPSDLKRGEGRGGARQYFKNVGEGGRESGERARAPLERPISNKSNGATERDQRPSATGRLK